VDEGGRFCCSGGLDGLMRGFIGAGGGEGSAVLLGSESMVQKLGRGTISMV